MSQNYRNIKLLLFIIAEKCYRKDNIYKSHPHQENKTEIRGVTALFSLEMNKKSQLNT